ncbi:sensor histidine kinase [Sessilibacter corallicola]|uniref:sensor histidine kinase n=1 Tax=Sessilibacter corallicola TaxID=2904075 RepID=UPI001E3F0E1B|nr:ATP-binding protein [Sessilibacter corallicola]MCE2029112.1 ATP-binding protein [Sessilibacter corallicola]
MVGLATEHEQSNELGMSLLGVMKAAPMGIIVLDSSGKIIEDNHAANNLLGCTLKGEFWRDVLKACFLRQYDDGHEISTKNGKRLLISTTAINGSKPGQIIVLHDQTETRKLQDTVNQQLRLSSLGKMVSALAHQIRTPLSAALLYAGHMCDSTINAEKKAEFSDKLRSRLLHLERQVQDMLLFVRGDLPLNDTISPRQLIQELEEALEFPINASGSKLKLTNAIAVEQIKCNKDALINAVLNLVNNAIQSYENSQVASGGQSKVEPFRLIEISCYSIDETIFIDVRDYGCGINESLMKQLVNPFVTTKPQGTGLGLAVIRAVANAHGGELVLENKKPGVLATIKISTQTDFVSISA